ncbi:MAG: RidA family protein [Oscillospiraceae bacterium]|jgi:2-iminobutanoate/2-iminopropanoate deaminase
MRKEVKTKDAPEAIGPYSQGISAAGFVFVSGQLPIDPVTGGFPEGGIENQTRQALRNLKAVLEAGGSRMENVVKTTVFLRDLEDFPAMNRVYGEFFSGVYPARSTVQAAGLPKGALVEIEAIALMA